MNIGGYRVTRDVDERLSLKWSILFVSFFPRFRRDCICIAAFKSGARGW